MLALLGRAFGTTILGRVGTLLIVAGCALVGYSVGAFTGLLPGGYGSVPDPVVLSSGQRSVRLEPPPETTDLSIDPTVASAEIADGNYSSPPDAVAPAHQGLISSVEADPAALSSALKTSTRSAQLAAAAPSAVHPRLESADAAERRAAAQSARPGLPVRLTIRSIGVDAEVKTGGLVLGSDGDLEWETLPFVATSYPLLGPVGARGNPVISGHVVTQREGNVFRDLYRVSLGESMEVYTADSKFRYVVEEIKLVAPTAVEVLERSDDARLTVITCGGTFDPRTRSFSERLILVGRLLDGERL